ncbi:MAG: SAVED domain-containing protein [Deltaproteobacteria bacterium]|nr:SAVED domain-containing protein [Deltaproteobacteria bacterium]
MAKAIAARLFGDDYQSRVFWIQVCRMFDERPKVAKVELEARNIKSLDDVVVHFDPPLIDNGEELRAEYYQVKFHVAHKGAFTWEALMDPTFINAASVSLLQRIRNAQQQYAPQGTGCRFIIYSPWMVHPENELAGLWSASDGRIRWEELSKGGPRSRMARVRDAWIQHLGLSSNDELRKTIACVRIRQGPDLDQIKSQLNDKLRLAGFAPVVEGALTHPYDDLTRSFIKQGRVTFTCADIEAICRQENLWRGTVLLEPDAKRLGVRSFIRATEYLEDTTDDLLCLGHHFNDRRIREPSLWPTVYSEIEGFLARVTKKQCLYHIHLPTHGSIAFAAGYYLDSKSGVNMVPIQPTFRGRIIWRPAQSMTSGNSKWQSESIPVAADGNQLAVAVSITHRIADDVIHYLKRALPFVGRVLHFKLPVTGYSSIQDGTHGFCLANQLISEIRAQRTDLERIMNLHLFWAAPNAFVFFLGQLARSLGPCVLYEYDFDTNIPGAYEPSLCLPCVANSSD